jgi:hypothetical protein
MSRAIRTIGAALVVVVAALMSAVGVAEASTGPVRLQQLAEAQTNLLLVNGQVVVPAGGQLKVPTPRG